MDTDEAYRKHGAYDILRKLGLATIVHHRREGAPAPLLERVSFDQSHASRAIHATHDRGVAAGSEYLHDRRLQIVRRRNGRGNYLRFLSARVPIIILRQDPAVAIVQFQRRIGQSSGQR